MKLLKIMLVFTGRGSTTVFNSMFYLESGWCEEGELCDCVTAPSLLPVSPLSVSPQLEGSRRELPSHHWEPGLVERGYTSSQSIHSLDDIIKY